MAANFLSGGNLDHTESFHIANLRESLAYLRDNYPDELSRALGEEATNIDISNQSKNNVLAIFIKSLQAAEIKEGDYLRASDKFLEELSVGTQEELEAHLMSLGKNSVPFDGGGQSIGGFEKSTDAFLNVNGNCDCDSACEGYNPSADCFIDCECDGAIIPEGYYDDDDDGSWDFGWFSNFFSTATTTLGNIAEEIGWDNIWSGLVGVDDDGGTGDTNIYVVGDDDDDDKEDGFNWLALGIGVLVTAAVVGGIIYFVRKSKAD
jgi:hypothetical protein